MMREEYIVRAKAIWRDFVPARGQSEFEQGELLRAVEKLRDEAQRNANANYRRSCHQRLADFLRAKLPDSAVFAEGIVAQIHADLDRLGSADRPYLDDDVYDRLCERVVDWCDHYAEPIPHEQDPELDC